jgi:hypothetical protein
MERYYRAVRAAVESESIGVFQTDGIRELEQ